MRMVLVECHPNEVVTWEEFKRLPAPAVALDGYVEGPPRQNPTHASFDHHTGVDRLATRATCEQVALAIRFGPLQLIEDPDRLHVHVNHADEDVCLSVWLLEHQDAIDEPRIRRLVDAEGLLDTTGGCYVPVTDQDFLGQLAWIFAPCQRRPNTVATMARTIREVGRRLGRFAAGKAQKARTASAYTVLERRGRVAAIEEHGPLARAQLRQVGIDLFVSRRYHKGRVEFSIGKTSPYVAFNLPRAFQELNRLEGCEGDDVWGGSETIGGSPRRGGTRLGVATILDVLERCRDDATGPFLVQAR
ncbi:MAG: hypothetical protein M3252_04870 [Actinomycetota bacterium]|nr:hypothetical protein [Actinomycetota bacterium]